MGHDLRVAARHVVAEVEFRQVDRRLAERDVRVRVEQQPQPKVSQVPRLGDAGARADLQARERTAKEVCSM